MLKTWKNLFLTRKKTFFSFALFAFKIFKAPSKPEKKKFSKKSENWFGKTRGNSKTSCEDGFSKNITVQELWAKNCSKLTKTGVLAILAIFGQFSIHNSLTVDFFKKAS